MELGARGWLSVPVGLAAGSTSVSSLSEKLPQLTPLSSSQPVVSYQHHRCALFDPRVNVQKQWVFNVQSSG